jgi:predicted CxxxxCH...CXXCH cytochrome family protein
MLKTLFTSFIFGFGKKKKPLLTKIHGEGFETFKGTIDYRCANQNCSENQRIKSGSVRSVPEWGGKYGGPAPRCNVCHMPMKPSRSIDSNKPRSIKRMQFGKKYGNW